MGKVVMYSTVSVDGFIADENDQPGPLFDWLSSGDVPLDETGQVNVSQASYDYTAYATHVLPSLILIGIGFGLTVAPSFATATTGVRRQDSGVASAMVKTSQQVGGSIGTALLSTLAVSAVTGFLTENGAAPEALRQAAVEGYTTAFWWAAAIFAIGALVCGGLMRTVVHTPPVHAPGEPAVAHL